MDEHAVVYRLFEDGEETDVKCAVWDTKTTNYRLKVTKNVL